MTWKLDHHISTQAIKYVTLRWKSPCCVTSPWSQAIPPRHCYSICIYIPLPLSCSFTEEVDNSNKCGHTQGWGCDRLNKEWTDLLLWGWKLRLSWNKNIIFRVMIYGLNSCLTANHKYYQMVLTASLENIRNIFSFISYSNYWLRVSMSIIWKALFFPEYIFGDDNVQQCLSQALTLSVWLWNAQINPMTDQLVRQKLMAVVTLTRISFFLSRNNQTPQTQMHGLDL